MGHRGDLSWMLLGMKAWLGHSPHSHLVHQHLLLLLLLLKLVLLLGHPSLPHRIRLQLLLKEGGASLSLLYKFLKSLIHMAVVGRLRLVSQVSQQGLMMQREPSHLITGLRKGLSFEFNRVIHRLLPAFDLPS